MSQKSLDDDVLSEALEIDAKIQKGIYSNVTVAAREVGLARSTLTHRIGRAREREAAGELRSEPITLPDFPDPDVPTDEIIDHMEARFNKRLAHETAKKWFPIKLPTDDVIGLTVVGDPHLGPNCNFTLLRKHVHIMKTTPGVVAINIGDNADNWGWGRLMALYADDDISRQTERRLGK